MAGEEGTEEGGPLVLENMVDGELPVREDDLERLEERDSTWMYATFPVFGESSVLEVELWSDLGRCPLESVL